MFTAINTGREGHVGGIYVAIHLSLSVTNTNNDWPPTQQQMDRMKCGFANKSICCLLLFVLPLVTSFTGYTNCNQVIAAIDTHCSYVSRLQISCYEKTGVRFL